MTVGFDFEVEYGRYVSDVTGSSFKTVSDNLTRWFDFLYSDPFVAETLRILEAKVQFPVWYKKQEETLGGMMGSAAIKWPKDKTDRLGMQVALFRAFADEEIDITDFASTFTFAVNNFDIMTNTVTSEYFSPFSDDLLRHLKRTEKIFSQLETKSVPASDRLVLLDHNSGNHREATAAVESLRSVIEGANTFPDEETKSELLAEVEAGSRLLRALRVNISALSAVLGVALLWLIQNFAGGIIGEFAGLAMSAVGKLLGIDWMAGL